MAGCSAGAKDAGGFRQEALTSVQLTVNGVVYQGTVLPFTAYLVILSDPNSTFEASCLVLL